MVTICIVPGQGGENRARHHERGNPLEPGMLGTPHRLRVNRLGAVREPEAPVHSGHKPTRAHCSPGHSGGSGGYPARPRSQRWCSFCRLTCTTSRQHPLPSSPAWQQAT